MTATEITQKYLAAWESRDAEAISALTHPEIHFKGVNAETRGREAFIAGCKRMFPLLQEHRVRAIAESGPQMILIYDFVCREPVGSVRTAEMLTMKDGLIVESELFFDSRPFERLSANVARSAG
jgi:ketosteroid isomerase-like protein